jgi:hypothetical protein
MTEATAGTAPAPADTPFVTDLSRLARVLFSPGAVFAEVDARPNLWRPWLLVSVAYVAVNYLLRPYQQRVTAAMMERLGRPVPADSMVKALIGSALTPIGVLIVAAISGGILFALVSAMGGETSFKKMMILVIHTWPILLIQQLITVIVLMSRGVASINSPSDMMVSIGLDLAVPADATIGFFTRFVLMGINPLSIWGLVIVAVGLQVLGKAGKGGAWAAAIIHFLIMLLCLSALAAFGMKMAAGAGA